MHDHTFCININPVAGGPPPAEGTFPSPGGKSKTGKALAPSWIRRRTVLAYLSLYRKWRPGGFDEVVGQEFVTRTLRNSLRTGNISHAYLFEGPRGTGKTSTARILAKALNCEEGPTPDPCGRCPSCVQIAEGVSVDVVEIDAASNRGIEDVRELREKVAFSPASARVKVYILDEAHMLTKEAFNALLKVLEEPPAHVLFVMATTEPHKMPPTILSRCQRFTFRSVPVPRLVEHLRRICGEEGIEVDEESLRLISRRARGSVRDALVLLEQAASYGGGKVDGNGVAALLGMVEDEIMIELGNHLARNDASGAVLLVERVYEEGRDLAHFAREAQEHFRRLFLLQHASLGPEQLEVDEETYGLLKEQAGRLSPARTFHFIQALREVERDMPSLPSPRIALEAALASMAREELAASPEALSARLERLEEEVERLRRRPLPQAAAGRSADRREPGEGEGGAEEVRRAAGSGEDAAAEEAGEEEAPVFAGGEAPSPTALDVDLAAVKRAWPKVKEKVKEKKVTTHAFLLEGKPAGVREGVLVISFPPERSFHCGELEKSVHRQVVEKALEEVLGAALKVEARLEDVRGGGGGRNAGREEDTREEPVGEKVAERAKEREGRHREEAGEEHRIRLVKDIFGAELVEEIKLGDEG